MPWTSPATWVANTVLTATQLNTQVRDNFKAIGDAWTAYIPAWTAATTNPVINNGTIVGLYRATGKTIDFRVIITMGSTTTYGSGAYSVSLPVAAHATGTQTADTLLSMGSSYFGKGRILAGGSTVGLFTPGTTAGGADRVVTNLVPTTFANTHVIVVSGRYESA